MLINNVIGYEGYHGVGMRGYRPVIRKAVPYLPNLRIDVYGPTGGKCGRYNYTEGPSKKETLSGVFRVEKIHFISFC